jgi:hypothetical protein
MEMGRRKQRVNEDKGEVSKRSRLADPFPSSPTKPPRFVLYCNNHENERQYVVNAFSVYAARKLFDALVGENEVEPSPLDPDRTMTFGDIDIKSEQMDKILAHQYSKEEEEWELPQPYPGDIDAFLTGRRMSKRLDGEEGPKRIAKEGDNPQQVKREAKPKVDRSKFITVQSLAADIGIDPRDARAALRKARVEKPAGGWLGDETWAKGIRDILVKAKKELDKRGK